MKTKVKNPSVESILGAVRNRKYELVAYLEPEFIDSPGKWVLIKERISELFGERGLCAEITALMGAKRTTKSGEVRQLNLFEAGRV